MTAGKTKKSQKSCRKERKVMKKVTLNSINSANSANRNNTVNNGASTMVSKNNSQEVKTMTSNNNKPNTLGELQAQISDAGNCLVWNIIHKANETYGTKWFDAEAIITNRDKASGLYEDIIVVDCDNIRAAVKAVYGDQDKYGDINPFIDYCYICRGFETGIDIFEYEKIREFFEG